jgi:hypothetical protein
MFSILKYLPHVYLVPIKGVFERIKSKLALKNFAGISIKCCAESRSSCEQKERIAKTLLKQLAKAILNTPTAVKVCTVFYDIIFDKH